MVEEKEKGKEENKENSDDSIKRNVAVYGDLTSSFFKDKNVGVFASGKSAVCGSIINTLKPLVYSEEAIDENYEKTALAVNKALKVTGAVAGAALTIANYDKLPAPGTYEFPFNIVLETPLAIPLMAWGGNEFANRLHCKIYSCKFSKDAPVNIPTLGDVLFGKKPEGKKSLLSKGIIRSLVEKSEKYLKENDPLLYQKISKEVEAKIERMEIEGGIKKEEAALIAERERIEKSCVRDASEIAALEAKEKAFYDKHPKPEKKTLMSRLRNRNNGNSHD